MKRALILTDGKAGHENQSRAFARALGLDFDVLEVKFRSKAHKAASYLLDRVGVRWIGAFRDFGGIGSLEGKGYAVVVGTGSGTFYAAKAVARRLGAKCAVVLYPRGYSISSFDCVLAPSFDRPHKAGNVVEIPANLVAGDSEFYAKGVEAFRARTQVEPEIAVVVGGPNKCAGMTPDWMRAQLDEIFAAPGAKVVTTSRRTPPEVEAVVDSYPWDWKLIYSRDHFNPIPAFVSLARRLCVTADSTGMISEACTFGSAEVVVLDNLHPGPSKYRRFIDSLRAGGHVGGSRKIDLSVQFAAARRLLGLEAAGNTTTAFKPKGE